MPTEWVGARNIVGNLKSLGERINKKENEDTIICRCYNLDPDQCWKNSMNQSASVEAEE